MIGVIDYGVGNIQAFLNVYKRLDIPAISITKPDQVGTVEKLILPGVGHFDYAMSKFNNSGLRELVTTRVLNENVPVLGVCVGMQMLANSSDEGTLKGLGWIPGSVVKFDVDDVKMKPHIPHMGWNDVEVYKNHPMIDGIGSQSSFYFLHSYYFSCENEDDALLKTTYGIKYTSMAHRNNIYGAQFHPEKSHASGVQLLKNFGLLNK